MNMNKKIFLGMAFLLAGILMLGNVLAFAVSSMYWEENPLTVNPGETKQGYIVLQNMAGTEQISAQVNILKGSEIATLDEPNKIYEIPAGQKIEVYFTVNIPADSQTGGTEDVVFDVSTVKSEQQGPMTFGSGAQKLVPVLVTAKPEVQKSSAWIYYIVVGVILLGIVALVILKSKKRK